MEALRQNGVVGEDPAKNRRGLIVIGLILIGLLFFVDMASWLRGGGLWSIVAAMNGAHSRISAIDVDLDGLQFPIMSIICVVVIGACIALNLDLTKKVFQVVAAVLIVGISIFINKTFGGMAVSHYMNLRGYHRCKARDHDVGDGKGMISFADYVLVPASCTEPRPRD